MNKLSRIILASVLTLFSGNLLQLQAESGEWISMFDGKSLKGWKSNEEVPNAFSIEDGAIKVHGGRAHLFYVGDDGKASFKNFEFHAKVKTTKGANSGIFFHTQWQDKDWPKTGYEAQVNATHGDARKSGSLYAVKDVMNDSPHADDEWFDYVIRVEGKKITLKIKGKTVVEYTEEENPDRSGTFPGRLLSEGTFALQGHDPHSVAYFKDIKIKPLP